MPKDNNHDSLFKLTFSKAQEVRALIDAFLPDYLSDALDLDSLHLENVSYVNEHLKEYFADIIYSCRTKDGKLTEISFLLEHKSYFDKGLPVQLLRYLTEGYSSQYQENKSDKLNFIFPVLIYHGKQTWQKNELSNMVNVPLIELNPYVPTFKYEVIDLGNIADKLILSIKKGLMLRSTMLLFKHKNDKNYILKNSVELFTFVQYDLDGSEKKKILRSFFKYIFRIHSFQQDEFRNLTKKLDDMSQAVAGSLWDTLISQGIEQGIEQENVRVKFLSSINELFVVFNLLPHYSDNQAAETADVSLKLAQDLRKLLKSKTPSTAGKAVLKRFFKDIKLSEAEEIRLMKNIKTFYQSQKQ